MLPGQLDAFPPDPPANVLQRRASRGLTPSKVQLPPDHGLFSDQDRQTDLVELAMKKAPAHERKGQG